MVNRKKIGDKNNSNIQALTRRGPPNRMNDLAYRDWMKFQKSFFWYVSAQVLIEECIYFFTKAIWPDGNPSRSLVVGFHDFEASAIPTPRLVDAYDDSKSMADMVDLLNNLAKSGNKYDFVLLDLRYHIKDTQSLSSFLTKYSNGLFKALRSLLLSKRYCGLLVSMEENGGTGFPFPWAVALSCRNYLRLRDEKVALNKEKDRVFYCLFMQADEDNRPPDVFTPESIRVSKTRQNIPAWTIPKPPPRKKGELLHPAKYPETLVEEFIQLFTQPGDNVFDPMVGTGSTVLAAVRTKRNGYGVDLIPKFVDIAQRRIAYETEPMLFHEMSPSKSLIIQGDATRLEQIPELSGVKFNYAITSPPYWSMLRNPGSEYQESRRKKNLPLFYSQHERDLGNVQDYDRFLDLLESVYNKVAEKLVDEGFLTVVVKNVKRRHILYPLAWDLVARLCGSHGRYEYLGTTLWCQDDVGIKPFAVGIHWVSNILHQYCLHFRKIVGY